MSKFDLSNIKYTEIPSKGIFRFLRFTVADKTYMAKALKEEFTDRRQYAALLKKEYEAMGRLQSPYLPAYYELIDDSPFGRCIIEEYIEGRTITEYLNEHHSEEEQEVVAHQLIDAVQSIHRCFMVHRNLNPANVIVTKPDDHIRLIGFRPSFADEIQAPFTSTRYLAPEQKDETVAVDTRSDIYSLGLILKQMTLPSNFAPVIDKCCSLGRTDRYMYAEDVAIALSARPQVNISKIFKWFALVIVTALVVGGVVYFIKEGVNIGTSDTLEESTSYILADTLATDSAKNEMQVDSTTISATSGYDVDSVKQVIAARLEYIYGRALKDSTLNYNRLNKRVSNCYYAIIHSLGKVTPEERDAIDQYFAKYRRNKDIQLKER